jgi:hypothetical protein
VEIKKVSVQNSTIKALIHFLGPRVPVLHFRNVGMCPALKRYGLLTEFPRNLYKVYFHQRCPKVLTELVKLIKVPYLHKILEKNAISLK